MMILQVVEVIDTGKTASTCAIILLMTKQLAVDSRCVYPIRMDVHVHLDLKDSTARQVMRKQVPFFTLQQY